MIRKYAEILEQFRLAEKRKLDNYDLKHGPTIGDMYEGLTHDILDKTIPIDADLKVVSGFIYNGISSMSGQIDCMLVQGNGEKIPYTDGYKWHIKDVVAVLEVKKELYTDEMIDSFHLLGEISQKYGEYLRLYASKEEIRIDSVVRTFEQITGGKYPGRNSVKDLPFNLELIFHCLMVELISPIRIVLGYSGFQREENFRQALCDFLSKNIGKLGYGPSSFPHLVISGKFSLVKANGQPFLIRSSDNRWPFLGSARCNPLILVLELIWTKIVRMRILQGDVWGDDLIQQNIIPLLYADPTSEDGRLGWNYIRITADEGHLEKEPAEIEWKPYIVSKEQAVIFNQLCNGFDVRIDDTSLIEYLSSQNKNINDVLNPLFEKGLIVLDGKKIKLTTEQLTSLILPTGEFAVGENNSGRLINWVTKHFKKQDG